MAILCIVAYAVSWLLLYFLLCWINPRRTYEWHCRTVTAIHALVITSLAAWCSFVQGPWPFTDAGGFNTPLQDFTICLCLGYFIFDFSWCLYFKTEGPSMMAHHLLSILGLSISIIMGKYGTELVATICGAEVTNPLLQLRWFLRETGRYDSVLSEIVDILFMLTFGFFRIGLGSVLLYCYFLQPTDVLGRLGGVCIYLMGWLFWVAVVKFAVKKYTKKWNARKETVTSRSLQTGEVAACIDSRGEQIDDFPSQEVLKIGKYAQVDQPCLAEGKEVPNGVKNGRLTCTTTEGEKKNM